MRTSLIITGKYVDSTLLMKISCQIKEMDFVTHAVAVMGTEMNKTVIAEFGAVTEEVEQASPNDLIVSVETDSLERIDEVRMYVNELLEGKDERSMAERGKGSYPSIEAACAHIKNAKLALISLPGEFAAEEARKALEKGMHVFIFSDNVPLKDELEIKKIGRERNLLVMGPGAGTAVIDNIAIGLMSKVRCGDIGMVAASGSGLQEIAVLIHRYGLGISQAIGTGGRDLSREVGGSTMLHGMEILEKDPETKVIVLVSKPPHPKTARKIYEKVAESKKPVVIFFLGGDRKEIEHAGAYYADSLEAAAQIAVAISRGQKVPKENYIETCKVQLLAKATEERNKIKAGQKYVRGTFCGGTHSEEAVLLLQDWLLNLHSNISFGNTKLLKNRHESVKNSLVDMGDEEFTKGRLHPVMDPTILCDRLIQEGSDPETAVILLDLILGYGVYKDPVGAIVPAIEKIRKESEKKGYYISIVASICGTDLDPQNFHEQKARLEALGVIVEESSSRAALLAGLILAQGEQEHE